MATPWQTNTFDQLRHGVRFLLWAGFTAIGVMVLIFSIAFVYQFLSHLWSLCSRLLFSSGGW